MTQGEWDAIDAETLAYHMSGQQEPLDDAMTTHTPGPWVAVNRTDPLDGEAESSGLALLAEYHDRCDCGRAVEPECSRCRKTRAVLRAVED
jgi:hypothetical protein